jgi:hypothetical protein
MPNWTELRHAYGSAEDLPEILEELEPDPKAPVWGELWGRVCHQGTTYSASMPVLPFLLSAASSWEPAGRAMPLALAGSIVSAPESVSAGYETSVEGLRLLALDTAKARGLSSGDRVHVMQSALAFAGDRLWGHILDHLNDGEFPGLCPACRVDLNFVIGQYGFFCAEGDWVRNPETPRTEIHPRENEQLDGVARWLYGVCAESGDSLVGEWVRYLFGVSTCPNCGQPLEVATAVAELEATP